MLKEVLKTRLLRAVVYKLGFRPADSSSLAVYLTEQAFLRELPEFDLAYLWPGYSCSAVRQIQAAGKPVVVEHVNCTVAKAKQILDAEYESLGVAPAHGISDQMIAHEVETAGHPDFLFCPSPLVLESFRDLGIPEAKLLLTSEGWSPQMYPNCLHAQQTNPSEEKPLIVLFVGSICVRKGVHLLLRAWEQAGIAGQLWLVGAIEPTIAQVCQEQLNRPDVVHFPYTPDLGKLYLEADVFAIASLEEGSPLVTYLALAYGLPILASPMGGGGVVRDGQDGFIVPAEDTDAWVAALRQLAVSRELRQHLGASSHQQAQNYTWERVAAQRAELLKAGMAASV
jgi:glycosyltransferase involved in cell wall biosynthesis